jgi:hypothetical protein
MTTSNNAPRIVPVGTNDVENFFASGERLYQKQRQKLQEEDAAYRAEKFRQEAEFAKAAHALSQAHDDSLRELDAAFARSKADGERMLSALAMLREG